MFKELKEKYDENDSKKGISTINRNSQKELKKTLSSKMQYAKQKTY